MPVATTECEYKVHLRPTHASPKQDRLVNSDSKRIIVKAGRRFGKTVGLAKRSVKRFLKGRRQLYAAPTSTQTDAFWYEVTKALAEPIEAGVFIKNETERYIELSKTKQRIKAKTAWNANTLRGDYADDLYLDEFQLMAEDTWEEVGQPMLIDNNGDAVFCYTPPSLASSGISKARDPRHASKFFKEHMADTSGLWECIHATTLESPYVSQEGIALATQGMSLEARRREIMAEDDEIEASWLVNGRFNESLCKIKRFTIPTNWDVYSGHDFGSANPAALFLARVKLPLPMGAPSYMRYNDLVAFREYAPGAGFSMIQHIERFKELTRGYTIRTSRGGNFTTEDEIRQGYTRSGWLILAPALEKKNSQIDRVISIEENNKLYIFEDLWMLLSEVANCLWKLGKDNKPTNEIENESIYHLFACLRHIASDPDFTPETVVSSQRYKSIQY